MAGPPPTVKAAAPIPTHLFGPVPKLGTAFGQVAGMSSVYQQHTGQPSFIPPALSPQSAAALTAQTAGRIRDLNIVGYLRDRFNTLRGG